MICSARNRSASAKAQSGVVLIGLLLLMVLGGTAFYLGTSGTAQTRLMKSQSEAFSLNAAKQRLIAYAAFSQDLGHIGYGRLPCQDTDNDGEPGSAIDGGTSCTDRTGRLPVSEMMPDGSVYFFGNDHTETDQQLWYRVSSGWASQSGPVNSATSGELTVNNENDIVAVLFAPGAALSFQDRSHSDADTYPTEHLEGANQMNQGALTTFVTSLPSAPDAFNDQLVAIRRSELMSLITPRVAETLYNHLEAHWNTDLAEAYPSDQSSFDACISTLCNDTLLPAWYASDQWQLVSDWSIVNAQTANLTFLGCSIQFTLTHGAGLTRTGNKC